MKYLVTLFAFFLFLGINNAQAPQGINFQGVARNLDKTPKQNVSVQIEFKIWDAPNLGSLLYHEKQNLTTNGVGLFTCIIGNGNQQGLNSFSGIIWATGQKYLEVIIDNQSSARQFMVSVPYALYAEKAGNSGTTYNSGQGIKIANNQISLDPQNAQPGQVLKWNGSSWTPQADDNTGSGNINLLPGQGIDILQSGNTYTITNKGDTNPNDDLTNNSNASGDVAGPFSNLQIQSGTVGTPELSNGAVTASKLNNMGAANGDVLKFQNGAWAPGIVSGGNLTGGTGITISNNKINSLWDLSINPPAIFPAYGHYTVIGNSNLPAVDDNGFAGILTTRGDNNSSALIAEYTGNNVESTAAIRGVAVNAGSGGYFQGPKVGLKGETSINDGVGVIGVSPSPGYGTGVYASGGQLGIEAIGSTGVYATGGVNWGDVGVYGRVDGPGNGVVAESYSGTALSAFVSGGTGGKAAVFENGDVDISYGNLNSNQIINVNSPVTGGLRVAMNKNVADAGVLVTVGASELPTFTVSTIYNSDNGYAGVGRLGNYKAGMYIDDQNRGVVFKDISNFRMPHPTRPGKEIWYACIEGPEAAAYVRGTAKMVNGVANVEFSEEFQIVANPETMTVNLTPLDAESKGMAVVEKNATGFKVKELMHGTGNYAFDWEVKCVRKGYEDYRIVRDARECQPMPPAPPTPHSSHPTRQNEFPNLKVPLKH